MRLLYQVLHAGLHPPRMMAPWYTTLRELTWDRRKGDAWIDRAPEDYWVIWRGQGEGDELEWKQLNLADLPVLRLEEDMELQGLRALGALMGEHIRDKMREQSRCRQLFGIEQLPSPGDDDDD